MKKHLTLSILLLAGLFSAHAGSNAAGDTLNLALSATVSTSFVSGWETLAAVNDGKVPANSTTKSVVAYGNWNGETAYKTWNWVQYEWTKAQHILASSVYWWSDGGGISQPTSSYISYWNGVTWVTCGYMGTALNAFNTVTTDVMTNKIRIYMVSNTSTGIFEWQVRGVESGTCGSSVVTPYVQVGATDILQANTASVTLGDSVLLDPQTNDKGVWGWAAPNGKFFYQRQLKLTNIQPNQAGTYTAVFTNECGAYTQQYYHLTVDSTGIPGETFTWPSYNPTIRYDFKDEFPSLAMPTKDLNDDSKVVGTISKGWWTFKWGAKKRSVIDSACVIPLLDRLNQDFAYFRDTLGWPPDKRAKSGYRSAIYLYGSGLGTDTADSTATGGWQGAINYGGSSWPMILASYYPIYCFSPKCPYTDKSYQTGAMVHEGIHAVLADLPGCKNSAWFQEGGNTWLQQEMESRKSNDYSSMGFLNAATFIAPFMPIECYSGWLQDDTYGGPSAEGVNMYSGSTQLCTWRNLLGGVQYSNIFPTFLSMTLGDHSVAWIWRNCPGRVLEGMAAKLGDRAMRRLITEYRAKQTLLDMGKWTSATKALLDGNFGVTIKSEWTPTWKTPVNWYGSPYVRTTKDANGLITPEYRTTPGWSGANQIPLSIIPNSEVRVNFQPLAPNMTCQLCYRTRAGEVVYSKVVNGGDCVLNLTKLPANYVVFAVICNTDYVFEGDTTRKKHFDYRLQLVRGVTGVASYSQKWYDWTKVLVSTENPMAVETTKPTFSNPLKQGRNLDLVFEQALAEPAEVILRDLYGRMVVRQQVSGSASIETSGRLRPGMYIVTTRSGGREDSQKLIVQ